MDKTKDRDNFLDILRGFAAILVVFAHCIQAGSGDNFLAEESYFSDRLYQFIYSFHMPLFMILSGYLAWNSVKKANDKYARRALLKRRAVSLLVPIVLWTTIDYARIIVVDIINGQPTPEAFWFVYFYYIVVNLWFLWAVWWCFVITYVVHYFFHDSVLIYAIIFMVAFVIPDGLNLGVYKYMLPYFLVAFYVHRYIDSHKLKDYKRYRYPVLILLALVYAGLFLQFNEESFIYLTGYKLIGKNVGHQLYLDFYRMLIGFSGSAFFMLLWKCIVDLSECKFKMLRKIGIDSMGIYVVSAYVYAFAISKIITVEQPSYVMNIFESVAVLVLAMALVEILGRVPYVCKLVGK